MTGKRSQHTCRISVHVIQQLGRSQATSPTESWATLIHHTSSGQGRLFEIFDCCRTAGWLQRCSPMQGPQRPGEACRAGSQKVYTVRRGKHAAHAESDAYKLRNQVRAIDMLGTHHVLWDALQRPTAAHMYSKLMPTPRGRLDCPSAHAGPRLESREDRGGHSVP